MINLLIPLHAGVPLVVSQTSLTVMLIVLAIILVGIGFGFLAKNKESLLQHRWSLTVAIGLSLSVILLVMAPALYTFYVDPDLQFLSALSIITIIHAALGVPAVALGLIYAVGDLPTNVRKWMRLTAILWVSSVVIGVLIFLQMQDLLTLSM